MEKSKKLFYVVAYSDRILTQFNYAVVKKVKAVNSHFEDYVVIDSGDWQEYKSARGPDEAVVSKIARI